MQVAVRKQIVGDTPLICTRVTILSAFYHAGHVIDYQSHLDLDAIRRCALASGVNRQRDFRAMSMRETLKPFHQLSTIVIVTL